MHHLRGAVGEERGEPRHGREVGRRPDLADQVRHDDRSSGSGLTAADQRLLERVARKAVEQIAHHPLRPAADPAGDDLEDAEAAHARATIQKWVWSDLKG